MLQFKKMTVFNNLKKTLKYEQMEIIKGFGGSIKVDGGIFSIVDNKVEMELN